MHLLPVSIYACASILSLLQSPHEGSLDACMSAVGWCMTSSHPWVGQRHASSHRGTLPLRYLSPHVLEAPTPSISPTERGPPPWGTIFIVPKIKRSASAQACWLTGHIHGILFHMAIYCPILVFSIYGFRFFGMCYPSIILDSVIPLPSLSICTMFDSV